MARTVGSRADITEQKIRDVALHLFARHGFAAVPMRRIAAEVGVQVGTLYRYTPDKQALLFDLMGDHMEHLLRHSPPGDGAPNAALEAFVRHHVRYHLDRPDLVFIAYMELRNLTPPNFTVIEGLRKRYETRLQAILDRGREQEIFDVADSKLTTLALIAMLTGVTTWYRDGGRLDRRGVEDHYWALARNTVGDHG